jgi:hypothetical protein
MRVKNQFSAQLFEKQYETNNEPSLTIPDQTLSIKQILERYASGQSLEGKTAYYDEEETEEYTPDPRYMDLADREQMEKDYKQEVEHIKTRAQKRKEKTSDETTSESE